MGKRSLVSIFFVSLSLTAAAAPRRDALQDNQPKQGARDAGYAARQAAKHTGDDTEDTIDTKKSVKATAAHKVTPKNSAKTVQKSGRRANKTVKPRAN